MRELNTEIVINASADRVWRLLMGFAAYPQWNPYISGIEGKPEPNSKLKIVIQPSGTSGMKLSPTVLKAEPQKELHWLGSLLILTVNIF